MEELLSLKWNNHKTTFLHQMTVLRKKSAYTDVTLACDGELYNVHKMVLSACSDYFSNIFENILCPNPVIILKDMSSTNLESLLDYMYLGEVSVSQADLASLLQSAECLRLKGLAVPESEPESESKKRSLDSSPPLKKSKRLIAREIIKNDNESNMQDDSHSKLDTCNTPTIHIKEDYNVVAIKEEDVEEQQFETNVWDFNPDESNNYEQLPHSVLDSSQYENTSCSFPGEIYQDETLNTEASNYGSQSPIASGSQQMENITVETGNPSQTLLTCSYCKKIFSHPCYLKRHMISHTGEKPFACPVCPYRAGRKCHLQSHLILRHRGIPSSMRSD